MPTLSEIVNETVCRALNVRRDDRPASVAEFIVQLSGSVKPKPVPQDTKPQRRSKPDLNAERRVTVRHDVDLESSCEMAFNTRRDTWDATVQDVSSTGMCLRVKRRFEVGTVLRVQLKGLSEATTSTCVARVRWVKEDSPKVWVLGCAFPTPLSKTDLESICFDGQAKTRA